VETLNEVLEKALVNGTNKDGLLMKLSKLVEKGGKPTLLTPSRAAPQ